MLLHVQSHYLLSPFGLEGVVLTPRDKVKCGGNRPFLTIQVSQQQPKEYVSSNTFLLE